MSFALCTIALQSIVYLNALSCDFGDPPGSLSSNALVACHIDLETVNSATVICPRRVNDTKYAWHPQPYVGNHSHLNAYVSENGNFRSVGISDAVITDAPGDYIWTDSNEANATLHLNLGDYSDIYVITERRLIFICGPRDLVLTNELQRHIDSLNDSRLMVELPWTSTTPLAHEISKIGKGLGVYFLYRDRVHLPLQGCGSRPSPLFASDNEVTVDPVTGIRSCVADPMSETFIGFLYEGRIEPADCMRSFLSNGGKIVTAHEPHYHWDLQNGRHWVVAKYFSGLALSPFSGECVCIDSETGHVTASIEIRPKTNYVCDISSMLERRRANPINGPWCSVVLHPGSTLTIRFPIADGDSVSNDATQLLPTDKFEVEFLPKDLTTLRQLKTAYDFDVYEEISYNEALAGDALEMNVSQMAQGEVKLKYHADKPLALKGGHNYFMYQWRLKSTNGDVPDKLRAIVKLSLALTHPYHIIGSDRGLRSVFGSSVSKQYNPTKTMESGMGNVYGGGYDLIGDNRKAGIYCRTDEELLPNDCESTAYDLHANRIVPFPGTVYNVTPYPIRGFQIYDMGIQKSPISYACICVDQRGKETSRLVLEANNEVQQTYKVRRKETSHGLLPYISLPWRKVALILEGPTSTRFIMLQHTSKKSLSYRLAQRCP
ncbi:hypothetical protein, conserved [Babesia ovata]|uniref:6-Cys domain-containing protein n=1 Tax=Babesia ovata TaxID=189622 RepID=A0A2H6KFA2_9APIC|nr:uncharacterized protein BOVATA_031320 [Babesia ovata]GBE61639.1 hypothetical protein, conserved [Babesia ovata]